MPRRHTAELHKGDTVQHPSCTTCRWEARKAHGIMFKPSSGAVCLLPSSTAFSQSAKDRLLDNTNQTRNDRQPNVLSTVHCPHSTMANNTSLHLVCTTASCPTAETGLHCRFQRFGVGLNFGQALPPTVRRLVSNANAPITKAKLRNCPPPDRILV
jgi:hypothetical protein